MADHAGVAGAACQVDGLKGFGERTDLVHLDQDRVGRGAVDALLQTLGVGDEQVVTHQLHLAAEAFGQQLPAIPVVFGQAVFDRNDREFLHQLLELAHHLGAGVAAAIEGITAVLEEFGAGHVQGQGDLFAGLVARFADRFHQDFAGFHIAQIRREAAFIAHGGAHALVAEQFLECVEHLGAHPQCFAEARSAVGDQHEFLEVQAVGGMGATVDHVHQRHRQQVGHRAAEIAVEGNAQPVGSSAGGGHAHRQDRVGSQVGFVVASIQLQHRGVHSRLIQCGKATEGWCDPLFDVIHGLAHALAHVAVAAITQLVGFVGTGAGTTGNDGPSHGTSFEQHLGFNRWVAAGIEHLSGHDGVDDEVEGIDHVGTHA